MRARNVTELRGAVAAAEDRARIAERDFFEAEARAEELGQLLDQQQGRAIVAELRAEAAEARVLEVERDRDEGIRWAEAEIAKAEARAEAAEHNLSVGWMSRAHAAEARAEMFAKGERTLGKAVRELQARAEKAEAVVEAARRIRPNSQCQHTWHGSGDSRCEYVGFDDALAAFDAAQPESTWTEATPRGIAEVVRDTYDERQKQITELDIAARSPDPDKAQQKSYCRRPDCGHEWDEHAPAPGPKSCLLCPCHRFTFDSVTDSDKAKNRTTAEGEARDGFWTHPSRPTDVEG